MACVICPERCYQVFNKAHKKGKRLSCLSYTHGSLYRGDLFFLFAVYVIPNVLMGGVPPNLVEYGLFPPSSGLLTSIQSVWNAAKDFLVCCEGIKKAFPCIRILDSSDVPSSASFLVAILGASTSSTSATPAPLWRRNPALLHELLAAAGANSPWCRSWPLISVTSLIFLGLAFLCSFYISCLHSHLRILSIHIFPMLSFPHECRGIVLSLLWAWPSAAPALMLSLPCRKILYYWHISHVKLNLKVNHAFS